MKKIVKNIIIILIPIIILSQFAISSYYYNKYKNISQEYNNIVELEKTCNSQLGQYETSIAEKDNIISNVFGQYYWSRTIKMLTNTSDIIEKVVNLKVLGSFKFICFFKRCQ